MRQDAVGGPQTLAGAAAMAGPDRYTSRVRGIDRSRAGLTVALLIVSLLTTALLALQAHATFLYHRSTAEKVLRDFARLAASEFVRRATARLGYDGYAVLLTSAARRLGPQGLPAGFKRQL